MSMPDPRNVIIPLWFAISALAAFWLPRGTFGWSLLVLALGLTVPAMVYVLLRDPPLQRVRAARPRTEAQRPT